MGASDPIMISLGHVDSDEKSFLVLGIDFDGWSISVSSLALGLKFDPSGLPEKMTILGCTKRLQSD